MSANDVTTPIEFREIPESVGYRFGSDGSVWSCWGKGYDTPSGPWRRLVPSVGPRGHLHLRVKWGGRARDFGVHRLICWAFNGPCPDGMECRHLDGDPANNVPGNLAWGTPRENTADAFRHGTFPCGERSPRAIFTVDRVRELRALYDAGGETCGSLARRFGMSRNTVKSIVRRVSWRHID